MLDVEVDAAVVEVVAVEVDSVAVEVDSVAVEVDSVSVAVDSVAVELDAVVEELDVDVTFEDVEDVALVEVVDVEDEVAVDVELDAVVEEVDIDAVEVVDSLAVEVDVVAVEVLVVEEEVEVDSVVVVDSPDELVSSPEDSVTGVNGAGRWCEPVSLRAPAMMPRPPAQKPRLARRLSLCPLCLRLRLAAPHLAFEADGLTCLCTRDEVASMRWALASRLVAAIHSTAPTNSRPMRIAAPRRRLTISTPPR